MPENPQVERRLLVASRVLRAVGAAKATRAITGPSNVRVTVTHAVAPSHIGRFQTIVRYLVSQRRTLTPAEFLANVRDREFPAEPAVLLTFDDGLLSGFEAAQRVLNPLNVRAIFFVPTMILELRDEDDMIEFASNRLYHRRRPRETLRPEDYVTMGCAELLRLQAQGHMVLPHTHSHARLADIGDADHAREELERPRQILEALLGRPADSFAFPTGTERVVNQFSYGHIRRIYSSCFTALSGANTARTNPFFLHRDSVHAFHPLEHVARTLDGTLDLVYAIKMRRLRARVGQAHA